MDRKTSDFIIAARNTHGDRYGYEEVAYTNNITPVRIRCDKHGTFQQLPKLHKKGHGCPQCGGHKSDPLRFFENAKKVHGDRYDYSKTQFEHSLQKIEIICREHGAFIQTPGNHLAGSGCRKCGLVAVSDKKRMDTDSFTFKARKVHGDRFDYSAVEYKNAKTTVAIRCETHGIFHQKAYVHLNGHGCPYCHKPVRNQEVFIAYARKIHGNRYDYSEVKYTKSIEKVVVACPDHGRFLVSPSDHLRGSGCRGCMVSHPENVWLNDLGVPKRQYKIKIPGKKTIIVDGYDPETHTAYEFHGDFWHGNPRVYEQTKLHPVRRITFGEIYEKTLEREQLIRDAGYNLVVMWEDQWR